MSKEDTSPVLFYHCDANQQTSAFAILKSMAWKLLNQQPDILVKKLHNDVSYMAKFRAAKSFDGLWQIFANILAHVRELFIIIDSIHECDQRRVRLMRCLQGALALAGQRCKLRIIVSSRHVNDLNQYSTFVIPYTHVEMDNGIMSFKQKSLSLATRTASTDLCSEALMAVNRCGGGLLRARGIAHLLRTQASTEQEGLELLDKITATEELVKHLWKDIMSSKTSLGLNRRIVSILLEAQTVLSLADIWRAVHEYTDSSFNKEDSSTVEIERILQLDLWGLVECGGNCYSLQTVVIEIFN
ncbi:hypothetical protein AJ80_09345 [Polytolypa hystricis UAMH7299]|uniref:Nephrocystin 3-like N-terminal domain-containing protein n=1 Tax=Polytolypa hystricis (strain UAMH7299) TaxID=1447883 RepID=A0A2B7WSA3_POLH7|nr:hypothetical protein AJ80_09345 [Polytolypa hystricis UAMH7299]